VQVHSDLNVNKASQEELQYAKTGVPLTQTRESETLRGTGAGTGGAAGAANNIPAYGGAAGAAGGNSNYRSAKNTTQYGVDKKVTRTEVAPGAVNRLDVAVMVDQNAKLTPPQLAALKSTLSSAAGLQTARGDTLQVTSIPFAGTPAATGTPGALPIPPAIARLLKVLGIALGALLFLFLVVRHLRRREREELMDQPSWLRELESAAEAVEAPIIEIPTVPQAELPTIATADPRRQALDHIVTNEPDRIAAHLRSWITEDNR
jgi:flagellar M-ring protein FliF